MDFFHKVLANPGQCKGDIEKVLNSITIHSELEYSILGGKRNVSQALKNTQVTDAQVKQVMLSALEESLATDIYFKLYCRPRQCFLSSDSALAERDHIAALSQANSGSGTWEPGWRVVAIDEDGRFAVARDHVNFWVYKTGLKSNVANIAVGDFCRVWVTKEMRYLVPGYYYAIGNGDARDDRDTTDVLTRFYWNLDEGSAILFVSQVTSAFNQVCIPFRAKVIANPHGFCRADSGVLYLERCYLKSAINVIERIHQSLQSRLKCDVPMFTNPILPGVGFAEDPGNGMSFGQSRSRIIAKAMLSDFHCDGRDPAGLFVKIQRAFLEQNIDSNYMHLNSIESQLFYSKEKCN
jgi:hypothetical protein